MIKIQHTRFVISALNALPAKHSLELDFGFKSALSESSGSVKALSPEFVSGDSVGSVELVTSKSGAPFLVLLLVVLAALIFGQSSEFLAVLDQTPLARLITSFLTGLFSHDANALGCAIIGWSGRLPKGLLTELLREGEDRGRDSTGIAYRGVNTNGHPANFNCRHALNAKKFVVENGDSMSRARRSLRGIGHTRRASPGMPIDNYNAHPFVFYRCFFAHNGKIVNWVELRDSMRARFLALQAEADENLTKLLAAGPPHAATAEKLWKFDFHANAKLPPAQQINLERSLLDLTAQNAELGTAVRNALERRYDALYLDPRSCQTDSMVLGPFIRELDFSQVVGCMALVWMHGSNVYTFRYGKEAVAAQITWKYTSDDARAADDPEVNAEQALTLVASTEAMVTKSLESLEGVDYECKFVTFEEDHRYRLEPLGLVDEGILPVSLRVPDEFSSATVPATAECELTVDLD